MCEIYKIDCSFVIEKNLLRNSPADIFIIRGGITQGKSQALYDV